MKGKISVTVEESLLGFLDSIPGRSRSEKIERILFKFKQIEEEIELRKELGNYHEESCELQEREIWERTVAETMWNE